MDDLVSVGEVADFFDLPASTLRYWERRGLIKPHRIGGRRHFDSEQLYRVALIRRWRDTGLMSLDDIAAMLAGRTEEHDWRDTVTARMATIASHIDRLNTAHDYLKYILRCSCAAPAAECGTLRSEVSIPATEH
ncbi:MerR family transcriptional regulator [Amycolatopsis anabasis]|uniref:MerR family transcriptional regulator n=1 Tax=Amycolatopsis anabasis TaxID=1840409 RepID=UPI00131D7533|nr:MerR family transcriptional regulator [Amycolatopsis anabasis]